jgi:uncharacterized membrane protein (UPF0127 family)
MHRTNPFRALPLASASFMAWGLRASARLVAKTQHRIAVGLFVLTAAAGSTAAPLPTKDLNIGIHLIHAEIAASDADRSLGLMYRRELPPNHGMLFIFEAPDRHCMWMKNTLLPLSVAFLDERGAVINVEDMQAQTLNTHCAAQLAWYALEMPLHWFQQRGVRSGQLIDGIPRHTP